MKYNKSSQQRVKGTKNLSGASLEAKRRLLKLPRNLPMIIQAMLMRALMTRRPWRASDKRRKYAMSSKHLLLLKSHTQPGKSNKSRSQSKGP